MVEGVGDRVLKYRMPWSGWLSGVQYYVSFRGVQTRRLNPESRWSSLKSRARRQPGMARARGPGLVGLGKECYMVPDDVVRRCILPCKG